MIIYRSSLNASLLPPYPPSSPFDSLPPLPFILFPFPIHPLNPLSLHPISLSFTPSCSSCFRSHLYSLPTSHSFSFPSFHPISSLSSFSLFLLNSLSSTPFPFFELQPHLPLPTLLFSPSFLISYLSFTLHYPSSLCSHLNPPFHCPPPSPSVSTNIPFSPSSHSIFPSLFSLCTPSSHSPSSSRIFLPFTSPYPSILEFLPSPLSSFLSSHPPASYACIQPFTQKEHL